MTTELTLTNPRNDAEAITKARRLLMNAQAADVAEIETATADINTNGLGKAKKNAFDKAEATYKDANNALIKALLTESGADAIVVQCAASQTAVKNAVKAYKAAWDAKKADNAAPLPTHTYLVRFTGTDAVLADLVEYAKKKGAAEFVWCVPQSDKAVKTAQKLFEENV